MLGLDGEMMRIGIGSLVNRHDLIAKLSPEDTLRIGSWHAAYMERQGENGYPGNFALRISRQQLRRDFRT